MICQHRKIRKLQLFVVSMVAFYLLISYGWYLLIISLIYHSIKNRANSKFLKSIGIAVDDICGTLWFGTLRHTMSANIGQRAEYSKMYKYIAKVVDYFFGENHCYCLAVRENLLKD